MAEFSFLMNGRNYKLNCLSPQLDESFMQMYQAFQGPTAFDLRQFQSAALEFFDKHKASSEMQDEFFNNFTILWQNYLNSGLYAEAEAVWDLALRIAFDWEAKHFGSFVHKGTPFYFWSMTAILQGDIDKGYPLMHRALEEDRRTDPQNYKLKPGFYFVTLDYKEVRQAFRAWPIAQADFLNGHIRKYNKTYMRAFTLEDFRGRFLTNPPSIEAVSLLGYVVAKLMRLKLMPKFSLESDFASQLEGNFLFDLVCVVDEAIRFKNPPGGWKFMESAKHLSGKRGGSLTEARLRELNARFNQDFETTMTEVLDGSYKAQDGTLIDAQDACIAVAYGLRNRWAHGSPTAKTIWKRFEEIKQKAFDALFLTTEFLY